MVGFLSNNLLLSLSLTHTVDVYQVTSVLQRSGVSYKGAQAFAQGLPVEQAADRKALASLFSNAIAQLQGRA
jgi:hypothetical protein